MFRDHTDIRVGLRFGGRIGIGIGIIGIKITGRSGGEGGDVVVVTGRALRQTGVDPTQGTLNTKANFRGCSGTQTTRFGESGLFLLAGIGGLKSRFVKRIKESECDC